MKYKEILETIKEILERNLEELNECESNDFIEGERTGYVDLLEMIQDLDKDNGIKFDYAIEKRFPL